MTEHRFRLVAIVRDPMLGRALAALQILGVEVEACNVIAPASTPRVMAPPKDKPRRNLKAPMQYGVSQRTRDLLAGFNEGDTVASTDLVSILVGEGFKRTSASSVVAMGLSGKRFLLLNSGRYKVIDRNQPITLTHRSKPAVNHG
jgi:hypothetical protein